MNRSGIRTESAPAKRDILYAVEPKCAISVRVNATGVAADAKGRKVIKAGTPIGGEISALLNRQTELSRLTAITGNIIAQGVTQHDIVFVGDETVANANMLIFAFVDLDKMETDAIPSEPMMTALAGKVTFVRGGNQAGNI